MIAIWSCNSGKHITQPGRDAELEKLASIMTGKFSSEKQAKTDTNYFNISLVMSRIWLDRNDGIWLYVEQAQSTKPNKPYRQRVYRLLRPSADTYTSDIYTIKEAISFCRFGNRSSKAGKTNL
jgi:CpeT protein